MKTPSPTSPDIELASSAQPWLRRPFLEYPPLPYALKGAQMACVVVREGTEGAFNQLIDNTLNAATTPGRFQAVYEGHAIQGVFHFDGVQSLDADPWGYLAYREATLTLLVEDTFAEEDESGGIRIFNPLMILDDPLAMIAGREIYGFPKMLGKFSAKRLPDPAAAELRACTAKVSIHGYATQSNTERAGWQRVIDLSVDPFASVFENDEKHSPDRFLANIIPEENWIAGSWWDLVKAFLSGRIRGVFLKQFPLSGDLSRTAYRGVIEAPYRVAKLRRLSVGPGNVHFYNPASYPYASILGEATNGKGRTRKIKGLGFVADMDWELGAGREL